MFEGFLVLPQDDELRHDLLSGAPGFRDVTRLEPLAVFPLVRREFVLGEPAGYPHDAGALRRVPLTLGASANQHGTLVS